MKKSKKGKKKRVKSKKSTYLRRLRLRRSMKRATNMTTIYPLANKTDNGVSVALAQYGTNSEWNYAICMPPVSEGTSEGQRQGKNIRVKYCINRFQWVATIEGCEGRQTDYNDPTRNCIKVFECYPIKGQTGNSMNQFISNLTVFFSTYDLTQSLSLLAATTKSWPWDPVKFGFWVKKIKTYRFLAFAQSGSSFPTNPIGPYNWQINHTVKWRNKQLSYLTDSDTIPQYGPPILVAYNFYNFALGGRLYSKCTFGNV